MEIRDRVALFEAKVDRVTTPEGCHLWTASRCRGGYGNFGADTQGVRRHMKAHRFAWEIAHGPIPEGMDVCHHCDVPACVRVEHLFLGTHADNMADMMNKGRHVARSGDRHGARTHPERILRGELIGGAKLTEADVREIRERRFAGEKQPALAAAFGVTQSLISIITLGKNWKHVGGPVDRRRGPRRGEENGASVLTAADVLDIRAAHAAGGVTFRALAEQYRVDDGTVTKVIRRENWRHI